MLASSTVAFCRPPGRDVAAQTEGASLRAYAQYRAGREERDMASDKGKSTNPTREGLPTNEERVYEAVYDVAGDGSKNYVTAVPGSGFEVGRAELTPFLMGRDCKLYIDRKKSPESAKKFRVTIIAIK